MKTTEELFFELLRVAVGQLDCLSRAPEPEEWQRLYELSKAHQVEGVAYAGVEKLFDFGLRAPQDVSIEWMSEAETIREANELSARPAVPAAHYPAHLAGLRQPADDELAAVRCITIQHVFRLYRRGRLTMRALMDYYYTLLSSAEGYETLRPGDLAWALLGGVGVRRFARGTMWLLSESMGLKRHNMFCEPHEQEGRYLFARLVGTTGALQRLCHGLLRMY